VHGRFNRHGLWWRAGSGGFVEDGDQVIAASDRAFQCLGFRSGAWRRLPA